ncbi:MAG: hypothetical protein ACK467_08250, partial [Opitutia bacterium]
MRTLAALFCLLTVTACQPAAVTIRGTPAELSALKCNGQRAFTAGDVVTWAQLDDTFLDRKAKLEVGLADFQLRLAGAERVVQLRPGHHVARGEGPRAVGFPGAEL